MTKTFDLKDDSVVVVIGSGAGGGTLSNELAQRGINVVCLEAGLRLTLSDIVNDNATMFGRLSWLGKRIGTGDQNGGRELRPHPPRDDDRRGHHEGGERPEMDVAAARRFEQHAEEQDTEGGHEGDGMLACTAACPPGYSIFRIHMIREP